MTHEVLVGKIEKELKKISATSFITTTSNQVFYNMSTKNNDTYMLWYTRLRHTSKTKLEHINSIYTNLKIIIFVIFVS